MQSLNNNSKCITEFFLILQIPAMSITTSCADGDGRLRSSSSSSVDACCSEFCGLYSHVWMDTRRCHLDRDHTHRQHRGGSTLSSFYCILPLQHSTHQALNRTTLRSPRIPPHSCPLSCACHHAVPLVRSLCDIPSRLTFTRAAARNIHLSAGRLAGLAFLSGEFPVKYLYIGVD